jgi:putative flavoprotein involved in K+ transport
MERFDVAIIGGGQAGLALSYRLSEVGRSHVVLEQGRIVDSWRTKRWDSLRFIAPNWSLVMPGYTYDGLDPDGFMPKDEVVERLVGYARSFGAPVREGVRVVGLEQNPSNDTFLLRTDREPFEARDVVLATGALQRPKLPSWANDLPPEIAQIIAFDYRNPGSLPPGAVLVVGSGQTGVQIAEELARAGRRVYLSGGRSWWAPRRYRGRDITAWLRLNGWFERTVDELPPGTRTGQSNPQLTGGDGGHDISARTLSRDGVTVLGRLRAVREGIAYVDDDLSANLAWADEQARNLLRGIDALIHDQGLEQPAEDWPAELQPARAGGATNEPEGSTVGPTELNLDHAGIRTIIWTTGYRPDLSWTQLPFLAPDGYPIQRRGVTEIPGLFIIGLDWLHKAKSGLFAGIDEDATYLASMIASRA